MRMLLLLLAMIWAAPAAGKANPSDPHRPSAERRAVDFAEVMSLAAQAPSVTSARQAAAAQRETNRAISGLGNPEVRVAPGVRTTEPVGIATDVSLLQPIPLTGLGSARRAAGEAEAGALDSEAEAAALGIRLDAATGFCALWGASRSLEDAVADAELAEELLDRMQKGAAAGLHTAADVAEARIFLAESRLSLVSLEGEIHDLGLDLSNRLEIAAPGALIAAGELPAPALPPHPTIEAALASIERIPDVALRSMQVSAARARARELAAEAVPRLGVGAEFIQDGPGDRSWYAVLSIELPFFERGQRERGKAAAEARRLEGERQTASSQARAALVGMQHEVEHTAEALEVIEDELLPAALEAVRVRDIALSLGEGTVFELLNARRNLVQVKGRVVRARADAAAARTRLALFLEASGFIPAGTPGSIE
ncbi:MAG TPA: TolC family protein [Vulgatibacter sp.]